MKAESTIRKQIRRLRKLAEDERIDGRIRGEAYEAYHALRWVVEEPDWTPAGLAEGQLQAERWKCQTCGCEFPHINGDENVERCTRCVEVDEQGKVIERLQTEVADLDAINTRLSFDVDDEEDWEEPDD